MTDPFGAPERTNKMPKPIELEGRLLLFTPHKIETVKNDLSDDPTATVDRLTTDLVVLDGGQAEGVGSLPFTPIKLRDGRTGEFLGGEHEDRAFENMWWSNTAVVNSCRKSIKTGTPRMILGRLVRGTQQDKKKAKPWILTDPTLADMDIARSHLSTVNPFA